VRAQNNTRLITFQGQTLRVRPAAGKAPRLLVLVHGLTGDENSMWVFVRNFPEGYWIVAPRAPHATLLPEGGYSWRSMEPGSPSEDQRLPSLADLLPGAQGLISLIDAYAAENDIESGPIDMIGFSQGGALINTVALLHPARIGRAGILSSFVPANADALLEERPLKGKLFFVAHGSLDEKVEIKYARKSVELLEKAGAEVMFCEDQVGHKVSAHCLRALESFFVKGVPSRGTGA
jgi:phospholipase/carboxylesterase